MEATGISMLRFTTFVLALTTSLAALAIDTTTVLPAGIRSAIVKAGSYNGLNEYYSESGNLKYLSDINSFELSIENLAAINSEVNTLRQILNEYPGSLGDQLHLGEMKVDAQPSVRYFAPAFAYGVTKKLTLALAVPVIYFENNIQITQTGSNLANIRSQIGTPPQELSDGFDRLKNELARGLNGALRDKGYKPLESKNENFVGDLQLISMYQFEKRPELSQALQLTISLPTGPEPDPDDLADIETFGRYSAKAAWITQRPFLKKTDILTNLSYLIIPKQNFVKRVPLDANDNLPAANQKYNLGEDLGDVLGLGAGLYHTFNGNWQMATQYSYEYKFADTYTGAPSGRAKYLEDGSEKSAHLARVEVTYSMVSDYFRKRASIPIEFFYELTKTLAGTNVENQTRHEFTARMFF